MFDAFVDFFSRCPPAANRTPAGFHYSKHRARPILTPQLQDSNRRAISKRWQRLQSFLPKMSPNFFPFNLDPSRDNSGEMKFVARGEKKKENPRTTLHMSSSGNAGRIRSPNLLLLPGFEAVRVPRLVWKIPACYWGP